MANPKFSTPYAIVLPASKTSKQFVLGMHTLGEATDLAKAHAKKNQTAEVWSSGGLMMTFAPTSEGQIALSASK